jgi:hypothetical protein
MKTPTLIILFLLFACVGCISKKNNTKKNYQDPAFYNLMTEGDTLVIFRKHLYYWNDRGPGGEGRSYNEFIQRFVITKTATEIVYCPSIELAPEQFPDTLKFDLFQTNINYFDDLFDLNLACADHYTYSEGCWDSFALSDPLAIGESEEFQKYEQGWPEYYKLRTSQREYFMNRQYESNYNFFDVIMHFRGRVKRFYSEDLPSILTARRPGQIPDYPPGQKPIGKIKK